MGEVYRSAIVPYSQAAMFELVADVEAYPQFLPGCTGASVRTCAENEVMATLKLTQGPLHIAFTTRNKLDSPRSIGMRLVDGPFRDLEGCWQFSALGEEGSKIALNLRFEFSNTAKELLFGRIFEATSNRLVDAFVSRARSVYG
jgi:ribosome-associated toxin RatA of RatAB toxin-antitoxin module